MKGKAADVASFAVSKSPCSDFFHIICQLTLNPVRSIPPTFRIFHMSSVNSTLSFENLAGDFLSSMKWVVDYGPKRGGRPLSLTLVATRGTKWMIKEPLVQPTNRIEMVIVEIYRTSYGWWGGILSAFDVLITRYCSAHVFSDEARRYPRGNMIHVNTYINLVWRLLNPRLDVSRQLQRG